MNDVRTPPKPEGWKKLWREHGVLATSRQQREAVFARDLGRCISCTDYNKIFFCDHVFPLWMVHPDTPDEIKFKYWSIDNLQTLCKDCHAEKTKREAAMRGKVYRIIKKKSEPKKSKSPIQIKSNEVWKKRQKELYQLKKKAKK